MDINVQVIDMDTMIAEQVVSNSDGSYTIFLNAKQTVENRHLAYIHALKHIHGNDFEKSVADEIEWEAHDR